MKTISRVVLVLLMASGYARAADNTHWQLLGDKSFIEWAANYGGNPVKGRFPDYTADIIFDPAHLEASHVTVKIALGKITSDDKDAQTNLPSKDWFDAADYPVAVFDAVSFTPIKEDDYIASGTLTLRGKSVKVNLPFTVKFYSEGGIHYARMDGATSVKRLDFALGGSDWSKPDVIADEVKLVVHVEAKQAP